jgi:hypothetical protein
MDALRVLHAFEPENARDGQRGSDDLGLEQEGDRECEEH